MRKTGVRTLTRVAISAISAISTICTLGAIGFSGLSTTAQAEDSGAKPLDRPLVNEELANDLSSGAKPGDSVEAPPPAEYPYPGAAEDGYKASPTKTKSAKAGSDDPILREANSAAATSGGTDSLSGSGPDNGQGSGPDNGQGSGPDIGSNSDSYLDPNSDTNTIPDASSGDASGMRTLKRRPAASAQPKSIATDGAYVYSTELKKPIAHPAPGVETPSKTDEQGQYFYKPVAEDDKRDSSTTTGTERPLTVTSKGQYVYKVNRTKATTAASVRLGMMSPPAIQNSAAANIKFADIYGENNIPVVFGDYEWRLSNKVGRLAAKFTTGVASSSGTGQFSGSTGEGRPSVSALEKFTFINFPNQGTLNYKFQYADTQIFVPYVEGGLGYFTFAELRSDNKGPKFGGAPVAVFAAGGSILLDWIDKRSIHQLDADYGVSHVWLTAEFRQVVGLQKSQDFTSSVYNVGFMMEF